MKSRLLFFDTEFTGLHDDTTLISIGVTDLTGKYQFYYEFTDFDKSQVDKWIEEHVISNLLLPKYSNDIVSFSDECSWFIGKGNRFSCADYFKVWLKTQYDVDQFIMWSDCYAYDWVLFRRLFGNSEPDKVNYIPRDLSTFFDVKGIDPDISREDFCKSTEKNRLLEMKYFFHNLYLEGNVIIKHNAFWDALVIRDCFKELMCVN